MIVPLAARSEHGSGKSREKKSPVSNHISKILKIKFSLSVPFFGTVRYGDTVPYQSFDTVRYKYLVLSERISIEWYGSEI